MPVPSTVLSAREQIKEALKLVLGAKTTLLKISDPWNLLKTKAEYPVAKAYYTTGKIQSEFIGLKNLIEDELEILVAPWCTEAAYELLTSQLIESVIPLIVTPVVQAQMDPAYAARLAKIKYLSHKLVATDLQNPFAYVQFTVSVTYACPG